MTTSITTTYDTTTGNWTWFTATASAFAIGAYNEIQSTKFFDVFHFGGSLTSVVGRE
jgi:hypothetical protein